MNDALAPLPPLTAIRAFEAAARHGSFTKAAQELHMTQAAVSYQIKQLEERLGAAVFVRRARKVELSPLGRELAASTTQALEQLRAAFARAQGTVEEVLVISTLPTLAASWLAPRLGAFQLAHPKLAVRMDTAVETVDLLHQADVAIRSGAGEWPGLDAHFLLPHAFTPLCSPAFLQQHPLRTPAQLLSLPRIGRASRWRRWLEQAGVDPAAAGGPSGVEFGIEQMEASSAMAGHGVAMISPLLFAPDIAAGRLVQPFDLVARDGKDHWLVYASSRRHLAKIQVFRQWVLNEASMATTGSGLT
jgi:LysR family transcriptional regulator, glycine cleavage system transcriptional activator